MGATRTRRLAWAFLFLLAMHEVSAIREGVDFMSADAKVASAVAESTRVNRNLDAVKDTRKFSMYTEYAVGKESKLRWKAGTFVFEIVEGSKSDGEPDEYVKLTLEGGKPGDAYIIMPDAAVVSKTINGMDTVSIVGWKQDAVAPIYDKNKAIYFRTETNPFIGFTKDSYLPWRWRKAGFKIFKPEHKRPYYINDEGKMFVIEHDAVPLDEQQNVFEAFNVTLEEKEPQTTLKRPDTELMLLIDTMLGMSSCLGNPSLCAYRCLYDPEKDMCGPSSFCAKTETSTKQGRLAPFGQKQMCEAVGSEDSSEEADEVLLESLEGLKEKALDLVNKLAESEAVSQEKANKATYTHTLSLFNQVSDTLSTFRSLPSRLAEDKGNFPKAAERVEKYLDLKHWRSGKNSLTAKQYGDASKKTVSELKGESKDFSVAAKLHSEFVDFLTKRPKVMIEAAKEGSGKTCLLTDSSWAEQQHLKLFVEYYMGVPGKAKSTLRDHTSGLSPECENFILGGVTTDVAEKADVMKSGDKERMRDASQEDIVVEPKPPGENGERGFAELWQSSDHLGNLSELSDKVDADNDVNVKLNFDIGGDNGHLENELTGQSLPQPQGEGAEDPGLDLGLLQHEQQQTATEADAEEAAFLWIAFCICAVIILSLVGGACLTAAGMTIESDSQASFVFFMFGGFAIAAAFCCAPWVGWVVLVASIVGAVVASAASLAEAEELEGGRAYPAMEKHAAQVSRHTPISAISAAALHLGA